MAEKVSRGAHRGGILLQGSCAGVCNKYTQSWTTDATTTTFGFEAYAGEVHTTNRSRIYGSAHKAEGKPFILWTSAYKATHACTHGMCHQEKRRYAGMTTVTPPPPPTTVVHLANGRNPLAENNPFYITCATQEVSYRHRSLQNTQTATKRRAKHLPW